MSKVIREASLNLMKKTVAINFFILTYFDCDKYTDPRALRQN